MFKLGKRANPVVVEPDLVDQIAEFVKLLETEETDKWCKCLWRIHPDDQGKKAGHCRICGEPKLNNVHMPANPDFHDFRGIRKTKVDTHPLCTVHTREGLIYEFIKWRERQ